MEEWRDVKGYEGIYQVSSYGRVRTLAHVMMRSNGIPKTVKGRILNPSVRNGYFFLGLHHEGKAKYLFVHQLVAMHFVDGYKDGLVVNHIDENKQNNHYTNLEWVTIGYNVTYRGAQKRAQKTRKENHAACKPIMIKGVLYNSREEAIAKTGLSRYAVYKIAKPAQT